MLALLHDLEELDNNKEACKLTPAEAKHEQEIQEQLSVILKQEEIYWLQRSWLQWLKEGDENTKFFHVVANGHRNRNFIPSIKLNGDTHTDPKEIDKVFSAKFKQFFG